jgi:S-adenosylmethionine-diacylgycerolhomoserine-N-methlytransferase
MSNTPISLKPTFTNSTPHEQPTQARKMSAYYRFHSKIYDITRWTFLFGRHWLIDWLPFERVDKITIMEVGCGTGHNLKYLSQCYPKAHLIGVDASEDMLQIAYSKMKYLPNKIHLINTLYDKNTLNPSDTEGVTPTKPHAILFSYCLTMVNPDWQNLVLQAKKDLNEGDLIAVVDFHNSPSQLLKKWMGKNHVRMDGHILPFLKENFDTVKYEIRRAYLGIWNYTLYIGKKKFDE